MCFKDCEKADSCVICIGLDMDLTPVNHGLNLDFPFNDFICAIIYLFI